MLKTAFFPFKIVTEHEKKILPVWNLKMESDHKSDTFQQIYLNLA